MKALAALLMLIASLPIHALDAAPVAGAQTLTHQEVAALQVTVPEPNRVPAEEAPGPEVKTIPVPAK